MGYILLFQHLQSKFSGTENQAGQAGTLFNKTLCWHKRTPLRPVLPSLSRRLTESSNSMAMRCIVLLQLTVFLLVDGEDLLASS